MGLTNIPSGSRRMRPTDTGGMSLRRPQLQLDGGPGDANPGMVDANYGDSPLSKIGGPDFRSVGSGYNPTMRGTGGFMSQIAGQTGMNQWNGGNRSRFGQPAPTGDVAIQSGVPMGQDTGGPAPTPTPQGSPDLRTLNDSFLGGKLFSANTTPDDVRGLRSGLSSYLGNFNNINGQVGPAPGRVDVGGAPQLNMDFGSGAATFNRGGIRDVGYNDLGAAPTTQSLDQIGSGSFINNINSQLDPVFAAQRAQALAQAKESAGNLTGSGFANILGNQVNKSLMDENAQRLQYTTNAVQAEQARQAADANRAANYNTANAGMNLQAQQSNQGADTSFIQQLLARSGQGLQADQLRLNQGQGNQNATQSYALNQGGLDQARNLSMFDAGNTMSSANAGRFSSMLGQFANNGVGPNQLVSSGGAGSVLGPLGQFLGNNGVGGGLGGNSGFISSLLNGATGGQNTNGSLGGYGGQLLQNIFGTGAGGPNGLQNLARGGAALGIGQLIGNNTSGITSRAAKAAGTGAAIGSVIPGVGTAIGAGIGAATPYIAKAGSWVKKHLFSDVRLKENIVPLGSGLYEYNFKGIPNREVGFIAQEVKKVLPSAVRKHSSGYLQVDYSKSPSIINALNRVN